MPSCQHMVMLGPQSVALDTAGTMPERQAMQTIDGHAATPGCDSLAGDMGSSKSSAGKCTPSAACASVVAPIAHPPVFIAAALSAALPLAPRSPGFAFFTGAPERPPRA